jgi:putative MFS transporter
MAEPGAAGTSTARVYWTAFIGLFFDYYDLYLFIYLEKVLAAYFALTPSASHWLQFAGLAGVGAGALVFGYLADRFGRGRLMLAVFVVYALGLAGLSLAWNVESLLGFRLLASLALGAEWGISHTYLTERVAAAKRYGFAALLQFSLLGGLLAAFAGRFVEPAVGWRWLFAASIVPVAVLSLVRGRALLAEKVSDAAPAFPHEVPGESGDPGSSARAKSSTSGPPLAPVLRRNAASFAVCLALASLTIASGTINVFFAKELPQSPVYTALFWGAVAPGMLLGAFLVKRFGVARTLMAYAATLIALSLVTWEVEWPGRKLAFALGLAMLNGVPFGLMGAFFNEVFRDYRTMLSGAAYNLGRILAGFAPVLITALGLNAGGNYFLFTAAVGAVVFLIGIRMAAKP